MNSLGQNNLFLNDNKKFLNHYKLLSRVERGNIMQFIGDIKQPQKKSAGSWHLRVQRNCNARASNWVYKLRVASLCTFNSTDVFGQWIRFGNILLWLATANHKDCCFKFQNWSRDEIFGWAWSEDFFTFEWSHKPSQPHRNLACNSGVHYWLQGFLYTTQK